MSPLQIKRLAKECILIRVQNASILVNCPIINTSQKSLKHQGSGIDYLKDLDVASIDLVLATDSLNICGLPFLLANPHFKAKILITDPVAEFAICLLRDFAFEGQNPAFPLEESLSFGEESIKLMSKSITRVKYGQRIGWFNLFNVVAVNSGYEIGASAWRIEGANQFYISIIGASSSSSLECSPGEFAFQIQPSLDLNALKRTNLLILLREPSKYSFCPSDYPDHLIKVVSKAKQLLTNSNKKVVLFPLLACGRIVFDFLEAFCQFYPNLDLFVVSSTFSHCKKQLDISTEWMHSRIQEKVYSTAEKPLKFTSSTFVHNFTGFDQHFANYLENLLGKEVLLILCSHPSKEFGSFPMIYKYFSSIFSPNEIAIVETDCRFDNDDDVDVDLGEIDNSRLHFSSEKNWLDPHLSLREICDLVKHLKAFNRQLQVVNVSFRHSFEDIADCRVIDSESPLLNIELESNFHAALAEHSLIGENAQFSLLKCSLSRTNNIIYLKPLEFKQEILHNDLDYTSIHSVDSFFFSSTRIINLFRKLSPNVELFRKENGTLCISWGKGEALIESEDGSMLRIRTNNSDMLSQIQKLLLSSC